MTVTETWTQLKKRDLKYRYITKFADVLAHKIIKYYICLKEEGEEGNFESIETPVRLRIVASTDLQELSSLTEDKSVRNHNMIFLTWSKQVRYI